jgi:hypothetical protein
MHAQLYVFVELSVRHVPLFLHGFELHANDHMVVSVVVVVLVIGATLIGNK